MPKAKGSSRAEPTFRCYKCRSRRIHVSGKGNTRVIHGVKKIVAPCDCTKCKNQWWSYHSEAIKAMRHAEKSGAAFVTVTGSTAVA